MTYTELVTFTADICENTFPTADMNMFIEQAEQQIYNTVQLPSLRKNVTGSIGQHDKYLSAPTDFLSVYSLAIYPTTGTNANQFTFLLNKDVNFIREAYPNPTDYGPPQYYALFGPTVNGSTITTDLSFMLGPTPDIAYAAELHYYYYPESIITAGTTWLGDNFDTALLNGVLVEAIRYMKGEQDMVALYQQKYQQAMVLLKNLGDGKERQDAYRSGQVRVQVV